MRPSEGSTGTSQSLARGLAILSTFHSDRPLIGVSELSRGLDLSRSTVAPLRRDPRQARLPAAGSRLEAVPARAEGARSRLLRAELDGSARDLCADPAPVERRDAAHGQRGDPRGHRRRLHRALPGGAAGPAGDRPQPPRRRAAARLLHGDGEGDPRLRPRGSPRGGDRRHRLRPARAEHADRRERVPGRARRDPLDGHRRERRGARVRAAVDRRADLFAHGRRRSPRSTSRSTVRSSRWTSSIARYCASGDRRRRTTSRSSMGHRVAPA